MAAIFLDLNVLRVTDVNSTVLGLSDDVIHQLTHCGLVTPYCNIDLYQDRLR